MKNEFTYVYDHNIWGGSGGGSDYSLMSDLFDWLNSFIVENNIKTMLDYGCGMNAIGNVIEVENYIGIDIVDSVVEFCNKNYPDLDIRSSDDGMPEADLLLVKDVLMHWQVKDINAFLQDVVLKYKYIVLVNSCIQLVDNPVSNAPHLSATGLSYLFDPLKSYNPELIMMLEKNPNDPKEVLLCRQRKVN